MQLQTLCSSPRLQRVRPRARPVSSRSWTAPQLPTSAARVCALMYCFVFGHPLSLSRGGVPRSQHRAVVRNGDPLLLPSCASSFASITGSNCSNWLYMLLNLTYLYAVPQTAAPLRTIRGQLHAQALVIRAFLPAQAARRGSGRTARACQTLHGHVSPPLTEFCCNLWVRVGMS